MTDKTQAAKPNNAKLLKELESKKTDWEREVEVLKAQIEPLRESLAGIPIRCDDCTYEQWQAQWAAQVLTVHYPGRVYALLRQISDKEVEVAQMEVFERSVMDDVVALELAAKYATAPD